MIKKSLLPVISKVLYKFLFFCISLFLLTSCGDGEDNVNTGGGTNGGVTGKYTVEKSLQGLWYRLDVAQSINLASRTDYEISTIESNLLKLTSSNGSFYVVRYGNKNNDVKIKLNTIGTNPNKSISTKGMNKSVGLGGVGGIEVVLTGLNNPDDIQTATTDSNGEVTITGVTTGDHTIEIDNDTIISTADITVGGDTDSGIFTPVSSGYTFKTYFTTYKKTSSYYYDETNKFIYGDNANYDLQIRLRNIGNADATAVNYVITTDDPLVNIKSGAGPGITGTIEPYDNGSYSSKEHILDLVITPKTFMQAGYTSEVYHDVKFNVVLTDVNNIKWYDYIIVRIYRRPVKINFNTTGNSINGFLIFPDHTLKRISTGSGSIIVPFRPDAQYKIMLSNTTATNETTYSIGVDEASKTNTEMSSFYDTSIYEPNNSEATAKALMIGDVITAYLHKGDLDYYVISMNSSTESWEPVVLKYDASAIHEYTGNGDQVLNFGESVYVDIKLKNNGGSDAQGVNAVLSTTDSYVTVNVSKPSGYTYSHSTITGGSSKWLGGYSSEFDYYGYYDFYYYRITVSSSCPSGHVIPFTLTMTDSYGNSYTDTFTLTVNSTGANIEYDTCAIHEYSGNGDQVLNYGESIYLDVKLKNSGTAATNGINAVLSTTDSYVTVNVSKPSGYTYSHSTITGGSSKWLGGYSSEFDYYGYYDFYYYRITVSSSCPSGHVIPFTLTMTDSYGNSYTDTFNLTVN